MQDQGQFHRRFGWFWVAMGLFWAMLGVYNLLLAVPSTWLWSLNFLTAALFIAAGMFSFNTAKIRNQNWKHRESIHSRIQEQES